MGQRVLTPDPMVTGWASVAGPLGPVVERLRLQCAGRHGIDHGLQVVVGCHWADEARLVLGIPKQCLSRRHAPVVHDSQVLGLRLGQ